MLGLFTWEKSSRSDLLPNCLSSLSTLDVAMKFCVLCAYKHWTRSQMKPSVWKNLETQRGSILIEIKIRFAWYHAIITTTGYRLAFELNRNTRLLNLVATKCSIHVPNMELNNKSSKLLNWMWVFVFCVGSLREWVEKIKRAREEREREKENEMLQNLHLPLWVIERSKTIHSTGTQNNQKEKE